MICIDIIMPGNCLECPCHDREYGHCQVDPNIDTYEGISDRPRRCPLVELKESPDNVNKDSETESMLTEDLISRQEAIDGRIIIQRTDGVEIYSDEAVTVEYLKRLPSVQPEQRTGH